MSTYRVALALNSSCFPSTNSLFHSIFTIVVSTLKSFFYSFIYLIYFFFFGISSIIMSDSSSIKQTVSQQASQQAFQSSPRRPSFFSNFFSGTTNNTNNTPSPIVTKLQRSQSISTPSGGASDPMVSPTASALSSPGRRRFSISSSITADQALNLSRASNGADPTPSTRPDRYTCAVTATGPTTSPTNDQQPRQFDRNSSTSRSRSRARRDSTSKYQSIGVLAAYSGGPSSF